MKHYLNSKEVNRDQLLHLFSRGREFLKTVRGRERLRLAEGKILATLFYEASTRTRFSFETAMLRLGGQVISNADMNSTSSAKKGESLFDTAKMVSTFADVIAMRHPQQGSVAEFVRGSGVPVINAGDGAGDHPTQGLLDLFTVHEELGTLDGLHWLMVGDLKNSRVVHSQCAYLSQFKANRFTLVAPEALKMPAAIVADLREKGFEVRETENLEEVIGDADVLSDTRIQEERFENPEEFKKYFGIYVLTPELMQKAKNKMIVIDPLPRVNHIDPAVDSDPRAQYFRQVEYGVAVRMALIAELLNLAS